MSINNLENATVYSEELDRLFTQKSATGFFADNAFGARFVGAKTVIVPDIDFSGLADYDRDTGFTRGAITVSNTSYTMKMDRARSLQIDREDLDETGVANLAGKILGEYVRTKVIPECDAYVLSKLSGLAKSRSNFINGNVAKPYSALCELIANVQEKVGYDSELVAFIDSCMYAKLMNTGEFTKLLNVCDFKQGEINLQVKSFNGVALIPVVSERMKTAYEFKNGGFVPTETAKETYMLVCPKDGAHLMKKTENMRIFTPEQNPDADAFKFDYRIYYDVFVKKSGLDAVWAWFSPEINFTSQPYVLGDAITASVESDDLTVTYQWYACDENGENAVKIAGATGCDYIYPTDLEEGKHYYFVTASVDGVAKKRSNIVEITV